MRQFLALLFVLVFGACALPQEPATPRNAASVTELTAKTVALVMPRASSVRAYCSGVWVGPKAILTAHHCVDLGLTPIYYGSKEDVLDFEGQELKPATVRMASILALDPEHDLALLEASDAPPHGTAKVALSGIDPGAPVAAMGHPFGLWFSYSAGHIAAVRVLDLEPTAIYVQTTAPTSKGNSGCGLFDARGDLVGIAHAGIPSGSNLAFYVHAKHVSDFLRAKGL